MSSLEMGGTKLPTHWTMQSGYDHCAKCGKATRVKDPKGAWRHFACAKFQCETCGAFDEAPCMTMGGYVATQPHAPRFKLGFTHEMQAVHLDGGPERFKTDKPTTPVGEIKLALWFIETIGGIEKAQRALDAVKVALKPYG